MPRPKGPNLWMVVAIIQPFKLDAVTLALERLPGFGGMTVSDCRGFGREKLVPEAEDGEGRASWLKLPGEGGVIDFTPKVRLEVAVAGRRQAEVVVETIARAAHTGRRGDGKVFVWHLVGAVRVRTLEADEGAL